MLNSLHKYQPRIRIVQAESLDDVTDDDFMTFVFPETSFMAVTAYQSEQVGLIQLYVGSISNWSAVLPMEATNK